MLSQQGVQVVIAQIGGVERHLRVLGVGELLPLLVGENVTLHGGGVDGVVLKDHVHDLILLHQFPKLAVIHLMTGGFVGSVAGVGVQEVQTNRQHHGPGDQRQYALEIFVPLVVFVIFVGGILIGIHRCLLP